MHIFLLIIIGIVGGLIGGMGMGGGTLLIPLLTLFAGVEQHIAQSANLIAFIPMSVVALVIHIKNKLVDFKSFLLIAPIAVAVGIVASLLTKNIHSKILSRCFGIFLIVLGLYQLLCVIIQMLKQRKIKKAGAIVKQ